MTVESIFAVSDDNVEQLNDRGIACDTGDELPFTVFMTVRPADPDVGLNADIEINRVECLGQDITDLVDEEKLYCDMMER